MKRVCRRVRVWWRQWHMIRTGHLRLLLRLVPGERQRVVAVTLVSGARYGLAAVVYPDLTEYHNVAFTAGLYGIGERHCRDRIQEALELVELWPARERPARDLRGHAAAAGPGTHAGP